MGIKFNCSNPACRQRVEVDDAMAGQWIPCPVCATVLRVPSSKDIKFACLNPACGQHIVVDVSEAGRFVKCPACGKVHRIPGAPPKPLISDTGIPSQSDRPGQRTSAVIAVLFSPWGRLICGWLMAAVILTILINSFNKLAHHGLPQHLAEMSDEIYLHGIGEFRNVPVQLHGNDVWYLKFVENDAEVFHLNLAAGQSNRLAVIRNISSDMGFAWIGWSPSARYFACCAQVYRHGQSLFLRDGATGNNYRTLLLTNQARAESGIWLSDHWHPIAG